MKITELIRKLKNKEVITRIDVHDEVDAGDASTLAELMKLNNSVEQVRFFFCETDPRAVSMLMRMFQHTNNIRIIFFNNVYLFPECIDVLAEALKNNTTIDTLSCLSCSAFLGGAQKLARSLSVNTNLQTICFESFRFEEEGLEDAFTVSLASALQCNRTLLALELCNHRMGSRGVLALIEMLKCNQTINRVSFFADNLCDEVGALLVKILKLSKSLTSVCLSNNKLSQKTAQAIATYLPQSRRVTDLDLGNNGFEADAMRMMEPAFTQYAQLMYLNLEGNNLSKASARYLCKIVKAQCALFELNVYQCNLGAEGMKLLGMALEEVQVIKRVNIANNNLGPAGAIALGHYWINNSSIRELDLSNNGICTKVLKQLVAGLATNKTMVYLDLSSNKFGGDGAGILTQLVIQNQVLQEVRLINCGLQDSDGAILSEGLAKNKGIRTINLSDNLFAGDAALGLSKMFEINQSLEKISLFGNQLSDKSGAVLVSGLKNNPSVTYIDIDYNALEINATQALSTVLLFNNALMTIKLGRNNVGELGGESLLNSLTHNKSVTKLELFGNQIPERLINRIEQKLARNQVEQADSVLDYILSKRASVSPKLLCSIAEYDLVVSLMRDKREFAWDNGEIVGGGIVAARKRLSRLKVYLVHAVLKEGTVGLLPKEVITIIVDWLTIAHMSGTIKIFKNILARQSLIKKLRENLNEKFQSQVIMPTIEGIEKNEEYLPSQETMKKIIGSSMLLKKVLSTRVKLRSLFKHYWITVAKFFCEGKEMFTENLIHDGVNYFLFRVNDDLSCPFNPRNETILMAQAYDAIHAELSGIDYQKREMAGEVTVCYDCGIKIRDLEV